MTVISNRLRIYQQALGDFSVYLHIKSTYQVDFKETRI